MNRYSNHILALWDIGTPTTERELEGGWEALATVLQTPIRTRWNTSTVRAVTTLRLPQQSAGLGATSGNL